MPEPGPVLALDLGEARIGIAVSDSERRMALPAGTIRVAGAPHDLKAIAALVRRHGATEVVVGLPLLLSGARGPAALHAEELATGLRAILGLPVHLQDERFSTVEAERRLRDSGATGRDRRRVVDEAAATVILQAFLDGGR